MKKIVVIGGGHGQSLILKSLKDLPDIKLSAIVTVADNGGSTGILRKLYNLPAMGDIRNVLVALASDEGIINQIMDYRFHGDDESDLSGHSLGNLIITALCDIEGSFQNAILEISKLLNIKGRVIPSTVENISLYARMDDDTIVKGEASIPSFNHHIKEVFYDHEVKASPQAVEAIRNADLIIYGIGSLYTSILPNIIIPGIREALSETKAYKVYFLNCMTQNNETFDYDMKDHLDAMEKHGAPIDLVIRHNNPIPEEVRKSYLKENSIEVVDNRNTDIKVLSTDLLDFTGNLVRHKPDKVREVISDLIKEL
ncbi:MAG: uridine diphosphate-N-acetylglucosamine-binding protein YvcK [Erysipelotrichaceae bacterium]|nr:uridine diphosphate-N-acetylglucosamine-binding protein YvcK [Erysipelotrichaceae bacterium]